MSDSIKVAIIDDGVSQQVIHDLCFDLYFNGSLQNNKDDISPYSHGSICAAIIKKYMPDSKIGSIRILDGETMRGNVLALTNAISWCAEQKIRIIHLSIGSVENQDIIPLFEAIEKADESIVIAACKNVRNVTFPASFPNVIGVRTDEGLSSGRYKLSPYPNGGIEFSASSCHNIVLSNGLPEYKTPICNSFAAPLITAEVYRFLTSYPNSSLSEVKAYLYHRLDKIFLDNKNIISQYEDVAFEETYPVVLFKGDLTHDFTCDIAKRFLQDGYLPLLFSTKSMEKGFILLDKPNQLESACHGMAEFCGADLILAVVCDNIYDVFADIIIDLKIKPYKNSCSVYRYLIEVLSEGEAI
ncbi:MAG: S8 family serine peptidase [Oscillospiraceae bacterium]|jgi:hypothetical protein|nr:S8 family serine peptidase [Oscillospiraceae bacterium]